MTGALVFGIGTGVEQRAGSATTYAVNADGNFTTTYSGTADTSSFIDSGSNGYFFLSTITLCGSDASDFYCPSSTENLSPPDQGANGSSGTFNFSVANAGDLVQQWRFRL